jgi:hypothetical protein
MKNREHTEIKGSKRSAWLKAAVLGGIWASIEIIAGSLLHNLHIPFSGTIMAFISVVLMISFLQVWQVRGVIWRAGLIAGLMKSLSPSAVILGPMTGIMMEALVVELVILLLGRNLLGYLLAGVGALLSAVLHKLGNLFILYGTDMVRIYVNLFDFLQRQFGGEGMEARQLLMVILLAYSLLGILSSLTGYAIGKRAASSVQEEGMMPDMASPGKEGMAIPSSDLRFRLPLLILHILMIPSMLLLINHFGLNAGALIPVSAYSLFLLIYYPRISGRLKKPFFWGQLLFLTLLSGLLWNAPGEGESAYAGYMVGLEMSIRAVVIVSSFSALSVEIRNPRVIEGLLRLGLGNAYAALSLAFASLPVMLDHSPGLRDLATRPGSSISGLIRKANSWLLYYESSGK